MNRQLKKSFLMGILFLISSFLVGFKTPETMYAKADIPVYDENKEIVTMMPAGTEVSVFESRRGYQRISYLGSRNVYVKKAELINYQDAVSLNLNQTMETYLEDHTNQSNIILIGDSRTYQLHNYAQLTGTNENVSWITKCGAEYQWLANIATPIVDEVDINGKVICILMGGNDCLKYGAENSYLKYMNFLYQKGMEWQSRGAIVVIASVTPCNGYYEEKNKEIDILNKNIMDTLPTGMHYLNTSDVLKKNGFDTIDGVHYNYQTCELLYMTILYNLYNGKV